MGKRFALIGVAGYIAPRHLRAIKDNGGELVVAVDPHDSVGILDSYFPDCKYCSDFEQFDSCIQDLRAGDGLDYLSICSPNWLHEPHIKYGLRNGMTVVCEKPLVLTEEALDRIQKVEETTGRSVNSILQLRHHSAIKRIKASASTEHVADVSLTYITSRGNWYLASWKGDEGKSGGVMLNIGIHFFDMLSYLYGDVLEHEVHRRDDQTAAGAIRFEHARVRWFLSVDASYLSRVAGNGRTYRSITIDQEELEFSTGFDDLHSESYRAIIEGKGYGTADARSSIALVESIKACAPAVGSLPHWLLED